MAKVELMPGIKSISGRVGNMIFRTYRNGKVRVYPGASSRRNGKSGLRLEGPAATNRFTFGTIAVEVARRMADGDTRPRKTIWAEVKRSLSKKKQS